MSATEVPQPLREKLATLREAVQNPAAPHPPAESLRQMFLSWADRFTVWHLRLLAFFDDPKGWFTARGRPFPVQMMGSLGQVLTSAYPELQSQRAFYDLIARDLWACGLMNTDGLHAMMTSGGTEASRTSDLGKQFLRFVTDPKTGN
jgi:hypothetical protein